LLFGLAARADAVDVKAMADQSVASVLSDLLGQNSKAFSLQVNDITTLHADKVQVRVGLVPIVAIAVVGKTELKYLTNFFQGRDSFVNRGQAGGGELPLYLVVDTLGAGMSIAADQGFEDGKTLRRNAVVPFF